MIPQFTKTLGEFILSYEYYESGVKKGWADKFSPLLAKIPSFIWTDLNNAQQTLTFENLLKNKYDLREIGAETDELFAHYLYEGIEEVILKYVPKIILWTKNFEDLFSPKLTLSHSGSGSNQNTYYLNPVTATATNLKVDNVVKNEYNDTSSQDVQILSGRSKPQLLNEIINLKNLYYEALESLEKCFMGLY